MPNLRADFERADECAPAPGAERPAVRDAGGAPSCLDASPHAGAARAAGIGFCPQFHHAVELIGRRWTGVVLRAMLRGATRFSDLRGAVPDLSDKMLAERLKELEAEGVVTRTVVPSTPVRVEYRLTEKGRDLEGVVEAVAAWAGRWAPAGPAPNGV